MSTPLLRASHLHLKRTHKVVLDNISLEVLESNVSDEELVNGVANGELAASIVDSNMLDALLEEDGEAVAGPVVNRKRRIAWAVRPDSSELLDQINQYITSERVITSVDSEEERDWAEIREKGCCESSPPITRPAILCGVGN